jgi:hypothetical protein
MASLLKGTANLLMAGILVRRVAQDLAVEVRSDAARSPYAAAGAATLIGVMAGVLIAKRYRKRRTT